jgi:hypothetical protein
VPESEDQRQQRAVDLAFKRGAEMAEINARLADHDRHLGAINGSLDALTRETHAVSTRVETLSNKFDQGVAVATARAADAEKAARSQVSARQFYVGLIGAVTALGTLLAATGHV